MFAAMKARKAAKAEAEIKARLWVGNRLLSYSSPEAKSLAAEAVVIMRSSGKSWVEVKAHMMLASYLTR